MKLLILFFLCVSASAQTIVNVGIASQSSVPPNTVQTNALILSGIGEFNVTVNGAPLGPMSWPFAFTYTSAPSGINNIVVNYCRFNGTSATASFNISSGVTQSPRSSGSIIPRRR